MSVDRYQLNDHQDIDC